MPETPDCAPWCEHHDEEIGCHTTTRLHVAEPHLSEKMSEAAMAWRELEEASGNEDRWADSIQIEAFQHRGEEDEPSFTIELRYVTRAGSDEKLAVAAFSLPEIEALYRRLGKFLQPHLSG